MEMWLLVAAGGVFLGGAFVYLIFMIFLPEWVGITGKVAKEAHDAHVGKENKSPEFIAKLQGNLGRPHEEDEDKTKK